MILIPTQNHLTHCDPEKITGSYCIYVLYASLKSHKSFAIDKLQDFKIFLKLKDVLSIFSYKKAPEG